MFVFSAVSLPHLLKVGVLVDALQVSGGGILLDILHFIHNRGSSHFYVDNLDVILDIFKHFLLLVASDSQLFATFVC